MTNDRDAGAAPADRRNLLLLHRLATRANETDGPLVAVRFALEQIGETHGWTVGHAYVLSTHPGPRYLPEPSTWTCSQPERFETLRRRTRESGFAVGQGMVGQVAEQGASRWIETVAAAVPPVRIGDGAREARSGLLVPVMTRRQATAVAVLEFYSERRRRESRSQLRVASSAGALLARVFEREYAERELARSREIEQQRIGRELHDTVTQDLTGITMLGERLHEQLERAGSPVAPRVQQLVDHVARTRARVHALSRGLLPVEIEAYELASALDQLATSTRRIHGIECRATCRPDAVVEDTVVANNLARIAQEAVQNAVNHAGAEAIEIELSRRGTRIRLIVADDGAGFVPGDVEPGVGMRLMRYRATTIGAELTVTSRPGRGTRMRCDWQP